MSSSPNLTPSSKCKVLPGPLILYHSLSHPSFCAGQGKALNEGVGVPSANFWPLKTILIATISEMRGAVDLQCAKVKGTVNICNENNQAKMSIVARLRLLKDTLQPPKP